MIQTGSIALNQRTDKWNLDTGNGLRKFISDDFQFPRPFGRAPQMALSIKGIDCENSAALSLTVQPRDVEPEEFNIEVSVSRDTVLTQLVVTWIAIDM